MFSRRIHRLSAPVCDTETMLTRGGFPIRVPSWGVRADFAFCCTLCVKDVLLRNGFLPLPVCPSALDSFDSSLMSVLKCDMRMILWILQPVPMQTGGFVAARDLVLSWLSLSMREPSCGMDLCSLSFHDFDGSYKGILNIHFFQKAQCASPLHCCWQR